MANHEEPLLEKLEEKYKEIDGYSHEAFRKLKKLLGGRRNMKDDEDASPPPLVDKKLLLVNKILLNELGFERDAVVLLHHEFQQYIDDKNIRKSVCYKNINDPVHGNIRLHPLAAAFMDTPQFQRLRHIKQLGMTSYVYPGGTHTRFEHSIGVYHLACKMIETIHANQPDLIINEIDKLCVQDRNYILNIVDGEDSQNYPHGRGDEKEFLIDIVRDGWTGLDVDRWDYYMRDCHHLGLKNAFIPERFMHHMRVLEEDEPPVCAIGNQNPPPNQKRDHSAERQQSKDQTAPKKMRLCVRDKERAEVVTMFTTRYELHRKAYKHPVVQAIDFMNSEALVYALGRDGNMKFSRPKTTLTSMLGRGKGAVLAFTGLDDRIVTQISDMENGNESISYAQELLKQIDKRQLWKLAAILKKSEEGNSGESSSTNENDLYDESTPKRARQCSDAEGSPPLSGSAHQHPDEGEEGLGSMDTNHSSPPEDHPSSELESSDDEDEPDNTERDDSAQPDDEQPINVTGLRRLSIRLTEHLWGKNMLRREHAIKLREVQMHYGRKGTEPWKRIRFFKKSYELHPRGFFADAIKPVAYHIKLVYAFCTDYNMGHSQLEDLNKEILDFMDPEGYTKGERP